MAMHTPAFWNRKTILSTSLLPVAAIYGYLARARYRAISPVILPVPVLCVGNAVAGGAGKTPVALALGAMYRARGIKAHYLSRGYGGSERGPLLVDPSRHDASQVGDEPLLLAEILPTWIARDRVQGGQAAIAAGAQTILLDDGYQNPSLRKTVSLLVIDGAHGFGNHRLIPAGPLRESVVCAFARADAVILLGEDETGALAALPPSCPLLRGTVTPLPEIARLSGKRVLAFAGIARPEKFRRTLESAGCEVAVWLEYPDHYSFKPADLAHIRSQADRADAVIVTTAKDYIRLPQAMRDGILPVRVEMRFDDPDAAWAVIAAKAGFADA